MIDVIPMLIQVVRHWAALSLGGGHAAGVSTDAECYTWGCNELGQLGYTAGEAKHVPTKMDILRGWDVKAIACGYAFISSPQPSGTVPDGLQRLNEGCEPFKSI